MTDCEVCRHEVDERDAHVFEDVGGRTVGRFCVYCCPRCGLREVLTAEPA